MNYPARSRGYALFLPVTVVLATACCLWTAFHPAPTSSAIPPNGGDLRVYRAIVERVHGGESYYDAAGIELRAQGYPTGSLFNWRPPLYAWLLGVLPAPEWGQALLCLAALLTLLLAFALAQRQAGPGPAAATVVLLLGAFLWCIDGDAFLSQELWAGVFITLSVCAYGLGWWPAGLAAGLFALFYRELSAPYCLVALFLAWRHGRRREAVLWVVGFMLYAAFLAFHASQVRCRIIAADRLPGSWLQFGGPEFLLATCRMNAFLFRLPAWLGALYLPLALFGLTGWRGETGTRLGLTVAAYVAAFAAVGQPFNDYWGLLDAPLLALGLAGFPAALRPLLSVLRSAERPLAAVQ
jgi:hypothetical protein